ncbi:MAG TPA: tetratricopeptide repeat protein, partial [Kiritimatiellia bacterium]|nr:tetratricopeptide repeat protein [Kiritimatiellia bacterium]
LSWPDRQAWEQAYERGVAAFRSRDWAAALGHFDAASAKDDAYAELAYRRAVCLQQLGRLAEAEPVFARALDLDAFRYRVDSRLNDAIRTLGASLPGEVELVDVARAFRNNGASRDTEWFVDHVHFSFEGTYELARLWADALARVPPFRDLSPAANGEWSLEEAKAALLFTPVAELGFVSALLGRYGQPPFNQQFDVNERIAAYNRRLGALTLQIQAMDVEQADARFAAHEERNPGDLAAPYLRGQLLLSFNRYGKAAEALDSVLRRQPHRRDLRSLLARALAAQGRADEAAEALVGWTRRHGFLAAQAAVGHMNELVQNGQEDEALAYGRAVAARLRAADYRWRVRREIGGLEYLTTRRDEALEAMRRGDPDTAAARWSDLMQRRPDWPVAPYWLSVMRSGRGDREEGLALIQRALNSWGYARASYHLGLWEARFGDPGKAKELFRDAARAAGEDARLAASLAWVLTAHPNPDVRDPALAQERLAPAEPPPAGFVPMNFF